MQALAFANPPPPSQPGAEALREEVRHFLATELRDRTAQQRAESWSGHDCAFSRKMGERGWLGMTWPKRYGGHERTALERYVSLLTAVLAHLVMTAPSFSLRGDTREILRGMIARGLGLR